MPGVAAFTTAASTAAAAAAAALSPDSSAPAKAEPIMFRQSTEEIQGAPGLQQHNADASANALDLLAVANASSYGRSFTDPNFGPNAPLLTAMPDYLRAHDEEDERFESGNSGTIRWNAWHRPSDVEVDAGTGAKRPVANGILGNNERGFSWTLFGDPTATDGGGSNPSAADVQQGALGDCWYVWLYFRLLQNLYRTTYVYPAVSHDK